MGSSTQGTGGRRRIDSAHGIALAALFVALGSAAYATVNLGANSVGPRQLQPNSVGSSEVRRGAIGSRQIGIGAIGGPAIQNLAIAQEHMKPNSVGIGQMLANSIGQQQLQIGSVLGAAIGDGTIEPQDLSPAARPTLYTDNNDGPTTITADTVIGTLSLPAGTYFVSANAQGTHTGTAASTRLECYMHQLTPSTILDSGKARLQANLGAEPIIFSKLGLQGAATLASTGTLLFRCASTNGSNIDLTSMRFSALRVASIVAQ